MGVGVWTQSLSPGCHTRQLCKINANATCSGEVQETLKGLI